MPLPQFNISSSPYNLFICNSNSQSIAETADVHMKHQSITSLHSVERFSSYLSSLNITLPHDSKAIFGKDSPLAQPYYLDNHVIGNRFCALPMEGWDATPSGQPSELTQRRWENFGRSGAKLIWGGEAIAVRYDGRGNPNQLYFSDLNLPALQTLHDQLVAAHHRAFGVTNDLLVGVPLTHSGRVSRPTEWNRPEPKILYHHPILDQRLGLTTDHPVLTDHELDDIVHDFVQAAVWSRQLGFHFVGIKHCHGYLATNYSVRPHDQVAMEDFSRIAPDSFEKS